MDSHQERSRSLRLSAILVLFLIAILPSAFSQTWEEYVDGQIKHHQQMELEEKKIEVLARMQQLGASNVNVNGVSSSTLAVAGRHNERDRSTHEERTNGSSSRV